VSLSILHVTQPTSEGVGLHVRAATREEAARGWSVAVASPAGSGMEEHCDAHGIAHATWEASRDPSPATVREVSALRTILAAFDPDVVHLHSSKAGLAGRIAIRGQRPTLFSPHAWSFLHGGSLTRALALRWERFAVRWSTVTVCVSAAERDLGRQHGIRGELVVVANAVDLDRFTPVADSARDAARRRVGVADEPLAVCVGRLTRQKGQDLLLDAWPSVRERVHDARLLLVGDGPDRDALELRRAPGVTLLGARDDVPVILGVADVVVLPSRWEGASYVLLEAMACGASVVATDVAGMREVLPADAGRIVAVDDRAALADAIADRLAEPGRAREEGARARAAASAFDERDWGERLAGVTLAAARRS
jgi:glycosyltransferase involved in cell wall biosynthesis